MPAINLRILTTSFTCNFSYGTVTVKRWDFFGKFDRISCWIEKKKQKKTKPFAVAFQRTNLADYQSNEPIQRPTFLSLSPRSSFCLPFSITTCYRAAEWIPTNIHGKKNICTLKKRILMHFNVDKLWFNQMMLLCIFYWVDIWFWIDWMYQPNAKLNKFWRRIYNSFWLKTNLQLTFLNQTLFLNRLARIFRRMTLTLSCIGSVEQQRHRVIRYPTIE